MDKINEIPEQNWTFDDDAVAAVIRETSLPLSKGKTALELRLSLEEVARQYFWDKLASPVSPLHEPASRESARGEIAQCSRQVADAA
jgi:hypothetical protein